MQGDLDRAKYNQFLLRFVEDFSGADIMLQYVFHVTRVLLGLEGYPHLRKFEETVQARPAWKQALEKGAK